MPDYEPAACVPDRAQADAILASPDNSAQKTQSAIVDLTDVSGQVVSWSGAAGDRSAKWLELKHGGEQKVADHLIDQLKKATAEHFSLQIIVQLFQ